jgi:UDP-N-acetyl-D-glucosamine dehydrogenase
VFDLKSKLDERSAHVVVSGIGYVGLPLAVALARAGFSVTGLDPDASKVNALNRGDTYLRDVPAADVASMVACERLRATTASAVLAGADVVVICVPTPLKTAREPDVTHIVAATEQVAAHQHPGILVVLESTTYPGTTSDVLVPRLASRFRLGEDVFIAYSPQRVDPGNERYGLRNTPKIVAGATDGCRDLAVRLYSTCVDTVVPVSSTATAELVKLFENTFRAVNVGLANELALMSRHLGVDAFEVVRAAATKPFGFMPFYPGPGVGGHCIPLDPEYLSWRLAQLDYRARFVELAQAVNREMPAYTVRRVIDALNARGKSAHHFSVLVYGVAYKRDVADTRESPAYGVMAGLLAEGARVSYMDPFVPELELEGSSLRSVEAASGFADYDVVLVLADHGALDRRRLLAEANLIVDTRDALHGVPGDHSNVYRL